MYSLDVNFLKDRPAYQKKPEKKGGVSLRLPGGNLTPIYVGVALGVGLPGLLGVGWWLLQGKVVELDGTIAQLDQESKRLDTEIGNLNKIKAETSAIKGETQALVTVFDQIRPWSAMLQDLRDRIPAAVQIENIRQIPPIPVAEGKPPNNPAGGLEITGLARSFNDVNDFLLSLQQSRFLKSSESRIITASLVDAPITSGVAQPAPGVTIKPPQVVKYTIQSSMNDVPASELIRELEKKGTVGLVTRIRTMQQTGVISK
ncbi:MAG: PilN domain-containing protein [Desmonostoc geniculatum HA4340-LM1]|uniref:PilN domain-containing protein n=1 Tax=Desmonostoc muscorum LEGE 12446 TaxID=1828758 RepID=A0A8J7A2T0_DESMC|nr:PilN domain-containing protein [Desmonostoc muscorum]MBW4678320.1 PilN domain-containing protein [Desmonostoc geniculatum HA4340-LM1]MCF2148380.1 PilN domain-containing protein [Desmonostoc muscorum LEGE 12446]